MESTKFPITIKKRNGLMIGISILEILVGVIFGVTNGGIRSALMWIFIFVGIITVITVLCEYSEDIVLKENKVEFYKNKDIIKEIKYSSIHSIFIGKGDEPKSKKKNFFVIGISNSKDKNPKYEDYFINLMNYSSEDFKTIKNIVDIKNSSVKVNEDVDKFIK